MPNRGPRAVVDFIMHEVGVVNETLERKLGIWSVVVISLSAMIGSGLFVLPALAMANLGGEGIWAAYVLAALVVLPGALSKAELATAMPTSGGDYIYIERTYGPFFGTISGLGLWASFLLKAAFALIGFAAYLTILQPLIGLDINVQDAALGLLVLIVVINILGVKKIKIVQTPIVTAAVLSIIGISIWAALTMEMDWNRPMGKGAFGANGWLGIAETAAFVFVSYAGVTKIAAIAEEVKVPGKNLPRGMLFSLFISTLLYGGIVFVMLAALPQSAYFDGDVPREDPIYVFAHAVGGSTVGYIAAILAILTMTSMALAGIMAASRYTFAMARDNLLPTALENVNPRYETPHWAIILTGLTMGAAILWLDVGDIAKLASGFQIMIFIVINSCVIVLRQVSVSHAWYQPEYRSPLYPLTQIVGIIGGLFLVILMGEKALIGAAVAVVLGTLVYFSYGRSRAHPKQTPWRTVRLRMTNPDEAEEQRRYIAFHAADIHRNNHLNLIEFISAMKTLNYDLSDFALRNMFHEADDDDDGVIHIDGFLAQFATAKDEAE